MTSVKKVLYDMSLPNLLNMKRRSNSSKQVGYIRNWNQSERTRGCFCNYKHMHVWM